MPVEPGERRLPHPFVRSFHTAGWLLAIAIAVPQPVVALTANVTVDASNVRATMSPLGIGLHTSPYYNSMSHPAVPGHLYDAGVTTLRFGGGGYADVLHWSITRAQWENDITGGGLSPWWGEEGNFGYVGPGSDFASFVRLLDQIDNGRAVVTVNYGSAMKVVEVLVDDELVKQSAVPDFGGQPKEAAAWVAYANADASIYGTPDDIAIGVDQQGNDWKTAGYWAKLRASTQREYQSWAQTDGVFDPLNAFLAVDRHEPVGITHWEIGNETFGTGYYSGGDGYSVDYDLPYGTNRSGNPNLSPERYGQDVVAYSQLMKSIDPTIKIGAVLSTPPEDWNWDYWPKGGGANDPTNKHWNPVVLAQAAQDIDFVIVHWYPWAGESSPTNYGDQLLEFPGEVIPGMIDGSGNQTGANAGLKDWLTEFGIPDTEIMVTEFRYFSPENIESSHLPAVHALFVADAYATWFEHGVTSVQYLEMLTKDFLSDDSNLDRGAAFFGISMIDRFVKPGDSLVATTSSEQLVRAHAALQDDGTLAVMLLNLDRLQAAEVSVDIEGIQLDSTGTRFTLTDGTVLSESNATDLGNQFTASIPPRTIATYVISAAGGLAGDFDGDGDVDGADFLAWQRGESPNPHSAADLAAWHVGIANGTDSLATVPEPVAGPMWLLAGIVFVANRW